MTASQSLRLNTGVCAAMQQTSHMHDVALVGFGWAVSITDDHDKGRHVA